MQRRRGGAEGWDWVGWTGIGAGERPKQTHSHGEAQLLRLIVAKELFHKHCWTLSTRSAGPRACRAEVWRESNCGRDTACWAAVRLGEWIDKDTDNKVKRGVLVLPGLGSVFKSVLRALCACADGRWLEEGNAMDPATTRGSINWSWGSWSPEKRASLHILQTLFFAACLISQLCSNMRNCSFSD